MPKKRNYKVRLRPHIASLRRKIKAEYDEEVDKLQTIIAQRDQQLVTAGQALIDKDKGRSFKSHVEGWWANRDA